MRSRARIACIAFVLIIVPAVARAAAPAAGGAAVPEASGAEETYHGIVREVTRRDGQVQTELGLILRNDQTLEVEILDGALRGRRVRVPYDPIPMEVGDRVFLQRFVTPEGNEFFNIEEPDRRRSLVILIALFIAAVLALGRWQGARALVSLAISIAVIVLVLIPRILNGASPVPWSAAIAIGVLALSIAMTHGLQRSSLAAFFGTTVAVGLTAALASLAVAAMRITGLADEAAFYLDVHRAGRIDLQGLLLGAIIIGAIGVLDDIAITQAVAVEELAAVSPGTGSRELFRRALRLGREHVGALVNTLALAYVGAAFPILLLVSGSPIPFDRMVNREIFSVEIIRTVVGSIGIIAAVPLTTWFAVLLRKRS